MLRAARLELAVSLCILALWRDDDDDARTSCLLVSFHRLPDALVIKKYYTKYYFTSQTNSGVGRASGIDEMSSRLCMMAPCPQA